MQRALRLGMFALVVCSGLVAGAAGCTHADCSDYHEPACWMAPPEGGADSDTADAGDTASLDATPEADANATPPP
jgi:hypothetical protein